MIGLCHVTQLFNERRKRSPHEDEEAMKREWPIGKEVKAKVLRVEDEGRRVALSVRTVNQETGEVIEHVDEARAGAGEGREPRESRWGAPLASPPSVSSSSSFSSPVPAPPLYSIVRCVIARLSPHGAFITCPSYPRLRGLIPLSQLASFRVEKAEDVVEEGEEVWVKLIEIKEGEGGEKKYAFSMKYVNQSEGIDLDEGNIELMREMSRRQGGKKEEGASASFPSSSSSSSSSDAIFSSVCDRCGGRGHMANDCFVQKGQQYEPVMQESKSISSSLPSALLPNTPPALSPASSPSSSSVSFPSSSLSSSENAKIIEALRIIEAEKQRKKEKKAKKKEKEKERKKKKKSKSSKKHKKRRRSESGSSSSSSDSSDESSSSEQKSQE